jgi:ubiquinone/menaquinone biosynthesis C-methylase UbiE
MHHKNEFAMNWEEAVLWLKDQPQNRVIIESCYFDDPIFDAAERFYHSQEWQNISSIISSYKLEGKKVLEIGAGRGIVSYSFAKDGWEIHALEPNPSSIVGNKAIEQLKNDSGLEIYIHENWGESLPFLDNEFDLIFCRQVLHHANELDKFCKEIFRVLKPNGISLCIREHVISKHSDLNTFLEKHPLHHLYGGEYAYTLKEYLNAFSYAGFKKIKTMKTYDSDLNTLPNTLDNISSSNLTKLKLPHLKILKRSLLKLKNLMDNTPGRLCSFVMRKEI